jgi:hypothetical protein
MLGATSAAACTACAAGTGSASAGSIACACHTDTYYHGGGGGSQECIPCKTCLTTATQTCSVGSVTDTVTCACDGYGDGVATCTACAVGQNCACLAGTYAVGQTCVPCKTRCPLEARLVGTCLKGGTQDTTQCICPAGYYYKTDAAVCAPCRLCHPNAFMRNHTACMPGTIDHDSVACVCNAGFVGNGLMCVPCPTSCAPNQYFSAPCLSRHIAEVPVCLHCPAGQLVAPDQRGCNACPAGMYGLLGGTSCLNCAVGSYSASLAASACDTCAHGTYATAMGVTACNLVGT